MKYFLYSDEQIAEKNTILAKTGKSFVPGSVMINGKRVKFTQLSDTDRIDRFVDTKVVASGELSEFSYKMPSAIVKRGI